MVSLMTRFLIYTKTGQVRARLAHEGFCTIEITNKISESFIITLKLYKRGKSKIKK